MNYLENSKKIELWAKDFWKEHNVSKVEIDEEKEKYVVLDFFPYPSAFGLHIGHPLGYIATDINARYNKLKGKNVLYAMGFDSFGLPAEQYAIETGIHPEVVTNQNISNIKKQLANLGLNHDETRTFNTSDPSYYKWTQKIFLILYNSYFDEKENKAKPIQELINRFESEGRNKQDAIDSANAYRLAFLDEVVVNWCPDLGTVLSNEEIINGKSERGNFPVYKKKLKQWMMKITAYSKRLVENLNFLDWPENIKEMQKNWIGLSVGWNVAFKIQNSDLKIYTFTTKVETLEGVTFLAINIEHDLAKQLIKNLKDYDDFVTVENKLEEKAENLLGFFTGSFAIHPTTEKLIPIYLANYVLNYGTMAVMGVPGHDERDYKFSLKYNIEIKYCMKFENSSFNYIDELTNGQKKEEVIAFYEKQKIAEKIENCRLKDWVFSRQRYWGEPFPIIYDENQEIYEVADLPVMLPDLDFKSLYNNLSDKVSQEISKPLDKALDWKNIKFIKIGKTAKIIDTKEDFYIFENKKYEVFNGVRETNTMPNWAGSCWYYLRYMDPLNNDEFVSKKAENYWGQSNNNKGGVDLYLGGSEHAVLHLLYARFWHMVLYDLGYVSSAEPFNKLFNQGMLQGPIYSDDNGKYYDTTSVKTDSGSYFAPDGTKLHLSFGKIGKRYKNGIPPEYVTEKYSVDTLRLYMMYLGPLDQSKPWDDKAIKGMARVLEKVWNLKTKNDVAIYENYKFNEMLCSYENDIKNLKYNTAIASLIIFLNEFEVICEKNYKKLLIIFSVFAPHLSEFLFNKNFSKSAAKPDSKSIFHQTWPSYEKINFVKNEIDFVITVNGKKRETLLLEKNNSAIEKLTEEYCKQKSIEYKKIIYIKDTEGFYKLVNIVV